MRFPQYRWRIPKPVPSSAASDLDSFSPAFQSVLYNRGIVDSQSAIDFLLPSKPSSDHSPTLLGIEMASSIILDAINKAQKIIIFGDYDTDGITSTAALTLALQKAGARPVPVLPSRYGAGYGLNKNLIDEFLDHDADLLITVDNGIRSHAEIQYAASQGLDTIITDHHLPGKKLPPATVVINPKNPADPYPYKYFAGVGVVYKLIQGLAALLPGINPERYLDLVALGTVADIVPLTGENRSLVKQGLTLINSHSRQGIHSLLGAAGLSGNQIRSSDISFQIAPRLNSSGRLENASPEIPLRLLTCSDLHECAGLAQQLENHNATRKDLSQAQLEFAESVIAEPGDPVLIAIHPDILPGTAGIVAGALSRKYRKPAIAGNLENGMITASCRSLEGFSIIEALENCADLFTRFGGHSLAAGFTIPEERIPELATRLQKLARPAALEFGDLPDLDVDAVVGLSDLNQGFFRELEKLEPCGEGNPAPVLIARSLTPLNIKRIGRNRDHLKLVFSDGSQELPAIGFGWGSAAQDLPTSVDAAFHFTENEYRGVRSFQAQILDLMPANQQNGI